MRSKCHEKYRKHRVANGPKPKGFFTSSRFFCQVRVIGILPASTSSHNIMTEQYITKQAKFHLDFTIQHFFLGVSSPNSYSTCSVSQMKAQISVLLDTPQSRQTFKPISEQMWHNTLQNSVTLLVISGNGISGKWDGVFS